MRRGCIHRVWGCVHLDTYLCVLSIVLLSSPRIGGVAWIRPSTIKLSPAFMLHRLLRLPAKIVMARQGPNEEFLGITALFFPLPPSYSSPLSLSDSTDSQTGKTNLFISTTLQIVFNVFHGESIDELPLMYVQYVINSILLPIVELNTCKANPQYHQ